MSPAPQSSLIGRSLREAFADALDLGVVLAAVCVALWTSVLALMASIEASGAFFGGVKIAAAVLATILSPGLSPCPSELFDFG